MIALAVGLLLAAGSDTMTLVPGTSLRFRLPLTALEARGFRQPGAIAGVTLTGPCRFFGLPSEATLHFEDSLLVRAEFDATASDYEARYVEDQLRRQGYRRGCRTLSDTERDCDWIGRTRLTLVMREGAIHAVADKAVPMAPVTQVAIAPVAEPDTAAATPAQADTLTVARSPLQSRFAHTTAIEEAAPVYPEAARRARIQGRVWTMALVDTRGKIITVVVVKGISELNDAAVHAVRQYRFAPRIVEGKPRPYWVEVPVLFGLH